MLPAKKNGNKIFIGTFCFEIVLNFGWSVYHPKFLFEEQRLYKGIPDSEAYIFMIN